MLSEAGFFLSLGTCRVKGITLDDCLRLCYSVGCDVVTLVKKLVFREGHKDLIQSLLTAVYPGGHQPGGVGVMKVHVMPDILSIIGVLCMCFRTGVVV
jgi:hypothetical protein